MKLTKVISKAVNSIRKNKTIQNSTLYDYSTKESREETIAYLLTYADGQRQDKVKKWQMCDAYYNNEHEAQNEYYNFCKKNDIPWVPAIIPDPYIHVESQVNSEIPSFEFSGRDDDIDSEKAKVRQYVCQYVLDCNEMLMKINRNQRRLNKLGNEIWKVGFDYNIELPQNIHGNIFVHDIDPVNFIPDPVAVDMDDAEYIDYVYDIHRMKAGRIFRKELEVIGIKSVDELGKYKVVDTKIYNSDTHDAQDDVVQVVEHWFRQPLDGSAEYEYEIGRIPQAGYKKIKETVEWEAGDIACSILINDTEIKYIPKYWVKTSKQNKMYPFTMGCKIPVENSFWDKSEIEPMKELVDAVDRELGMALLNDTFHASDIIIMDGDSMTEGSSPIAVPSAIWKLKPGAREPKRIGGLSNLNGGLKDTINFLRDIIKQVVGNFDVNMGDAPPGNVRTLGGLVQLKEQGNTRQNKKKAGTIAMWERLLKLIDYTAIEFFDDNRLIFIGAEKADKTELTADEQGNVVQKAMPVTFRYNSENLKVFDDYSESYYYPVVDAKINVGDGIRNSPAMTIQATEDLLGKQITPANYKVAMSLVDQLNLPNRKEIKDAWEKQFSQPQGQPQTNVNDLLAGLSPEELQYLDENPQMLAQFMQQNGVKMGGVA